MKTVSSMLTLLMNTINLSHITQVAEGTVFKITHGSYAKFKIAIKFRSQRISELSLGGQLSKFTGFYTQS